jgi:pimeloyl-ACP methyl ester carboxylesterase
MPFFDHKGIKFNYIDDGEGVPFVFQHGLGGSLEQPKGLFAPPKGIRFLSFDFRGHGDTQIGLEEELSFKTFAEDLAAFMEYLQIEKAIVGGISMGAAVALNFVLRYPERTIGCVFSRPAWLDHPMPQSHQNLFRDIAKLILEHGPDRGREIFGKSPRYARLQQESQAVAQSFLNYFDYKHAKTTVKKFLSMPADMPCSNKREWKKIGIPVLIIANGSDPIHPLKYGRIMAEYIYQAEFHEITAKSIDSKQHLADVQKYLEEFLQKHFI